MCAANSKSFTFDDPLAPDLWHIRLINAAPVYPDVTGAGVRIAVIDDGVQADHPDLAAAYDGSRDLDARSGDPDGSPRYDGEDGDNHGTSVAGLIAARGDNGIGIHGVAWEATISSIRLPFSEVEIDGEEDRPADYAAAFTRAGEYDIANNSWGLSDGSYDIYRPEWNGMFAALRQGVSEGRDGLGTVFLFAAGNERLEGLDTNYSNLTNLHEVIAVAAVNQSGRYAYYSSPGASLLVAAPAASVSTDRTGSDGYNEGQSNELADRDYTNDFGGTSAATPVTSGVVALMLEAEPGLGQRDVKEILAWSAHLSGAAGGYQRNGGSDWNGGGLHFSHDYGAGLVDAAAAVRLASTWLVTGTGARTESDLQVVTAVGSGGGVLDDDSPVTITFTVGAGGIDRIEDIELDLTFGHADLSQVTITLISPSGTESLLLDQPTSLASEDPPPPYRFGSTQDWGESPAGTWTLTLEDLVADETGGEVGAASLLLYGATPSADDRHLLTDEYKKFPQVGGPLLDTAGNDTLNLATLTKAATLDLRPGSVSKIAGKPFALDAATVIENAIGGQGKDRLTGNDAANLLAGRGGNDLLDGGAGFDTALFFGLRAEFVVSQGKGGVLVRDTTGGDGRDTLIAIEQLRFDDGTFSLESLLTS